MGNDSLFDLIKDFSREKQQTFLTIASQEGDEYTINLIRRAKNENLNISIEQVGPDGCCSDTIRIILS